MPRRAKRTDEDDEAKEMDNGENNRAVRNSVWIWQCVPFSCFVHHGEGGQMKNGIELPPIDESDHVSLKEGAVIVKIGTVSHELSVVDALAIAGQIIAACEVALGG